jgi:hypothetical protein
MVTLIIVGNIMNISADLGARSAPIKLIFPQTSLIGLSIFFSVISNFLKCYNYFFIV